MFCEYCGRKINGNQYNCPHCKRDFRKLQSGEVRSPAFNDSKNQQPPVVQAAPYIEPQPQVREHPNRTKKRNLFTIVHLGIIAILLFCVISLSITCGKLSSQLNQINENTKTNTDTISKLKKKYDGIKGELDKLKENKKAEAQNPAPTEDPNKHNGANQNSAQNTGTP